MQSRSEAVGVQTAEIRPSAPNSASSNRHRAESGHRQVEDEEIVAFADKVIDSALARSDRSGDGPQRAFNRPASRASASLAGAGLALCGTVA